MQSKPLDSKKAGIRNERLLLTLLREKGPLSQKQLCLGTGLGSSTASTIVSRLRDKGLINEFQGKSAARGPKPVMLSINPEGRFLVGAELSATHLRIEIFNFFVESVVYGTFPLHSSEANDVADQLILSVLGLLSKERIDPAIVDGMGITISGSVTPGGLVELSSTLGWRQVHLRDILGRHLPFPIHIFSTRVRLLTEMDLIPADDVQNVLYLNVADGVGANVVIDGLLLHGAGNRVGEIGHVIVEPGGPTCGCGHAGCLEALVSGPALAGRIQRDLANGQESVLSKEIPSASHRTLVQKWGAAMENRDDYALTLQDFVTDKLSRAFAMAINLYDPKLVILGGYVCHQVFGALKKRIQSVITSDVYDGESRGLMIQPAKAGRSRYTKGAAIGVLTDDTSEEFGALLP